MIVGTGSLSKLLNDREGFIFYAAGISNSQIKLTTNDIMEGMRESLNLGIVSGRAIHDGSMLVYFSSISIFFVKSEYTEHKIHMEDAIRKTLPNYCIIRLGNIWECTNPKTFINAYKAKPYEPRDEYKYMISKEQLNFVTDNLPRTGKHEISIFGEALKVKECLTR